MNKALLLLLVTFVQCQSDGIFLPPQSNSDKFDENVDGFQLEDWENSEVPYPIDITKNYDQTAPAFEKRSTNDVLTRRSALDKNFMRFGRNSGIPFPEKNSRHSGLLPTKNNFFRFGRGYKDSFIRFGRGAQDNFIRFGRGAKDSFIRFGRGGSDDFFRSGKSGRENFIRFGKVDKNFMRFGRNRPKNDEEQENIDNQDYLSNSGDTNGKLKEMLGGFERIGKSPGKPENFIRFGKSGNQKESRNGTNFLRFGKKDYSESIDTTETDDSDIDSDNHDLSADILKYGSFVRTKRQTLDTNNMNNNSGNKNVDKNKIFEKFKSNVESGIVSNGKTEERENRTIQKNKFLDKRSIGFFEERPENFPRRPPPILVSSSWQDIKNLENSRMTPFFPVSSKFPNYFSNHHFFISGRDSEAKRDKGGSNFIRFG